MLDTNVKKEATRVGKSFLTDEAFVVLKKLCIFLLEEAPEKKTIVFVRGKYLKVKKGRKHDLVMKLTGF